MSKTKQQLHFTTEQEKKIFQFLENCFKQKPKVAAQLRLGKKVDYDKVYLTVIDQGHIRCCQSGNIATDAKNRLEQDLRSAVHDCLNDERFGKKITPGEIKKCHLVLEFLYNKQRVKISPPAGLDHQIVSGLNALEIINRDKKAYYKAAVMIEKNLDLSAALIKLRKKAHLPKNALKNPTTKLYKFDTVSFLKKPSGKIIDLFRCNPFPETSKPNSPEILKHLKLAASWIENNIDPKTGLPQYLYRPSKKSYLTHVNHLRILGLSWGAILLSKQLRRPALQKIGTKIVGEYLSKYQQTTPKGIYLKIDGQAKISFNAFLILSLLELEKFPRQKILLEKLTGILPTRQQKNGGFLTDFEKVTHHSSDFYPGEILLALISYQRTNPGQNFLPVIEKAFEYYRAYWRKNRSTAFIPWHTQTYYQIYLKTKAPEPAKFIFEMNDWLLKKQITSHADPDLIGSFRPHSAINTASYLEGLLDAWKLADMLKDQKRAKKYLQAIKIAIAFVLRTQYTPENTYYLSKPQKALGGFRKSLTDNIERCDFVQHASVALSKALYYKIFNKR